SSHGKGRIREKRLSVAILLFKDSCEAKSAESTDRAILASTQGNSRLNTRELRLNEARLVSTATLRTSILSKRFGPGRMHQLSGRLPDKRVQVCQVVAIRQQGALFLSS